MKFVTKDHTEEGHLWFNNFRKWHLVGRWFNVYIAQKNKAISTELSRTISHKFCLIHIENELNLI